MLQIDRYVSLEIRLFYKLGTFGKEKVPVRNVLTCYDVYECFYSRLVSNSFVHQKAHLS